VARQCPNAAGTHLLLAGLFAQFASLDAELDAALAAGPQQWAELWARDKGLLAIATTARRKRLEKALALLHKDSRV
jgi:hypothetical protein